MGSPGPNASPSASSESAIGRFRRFRREVRDRLVEGLLVMLPILVTLWVVKWLYQSLAYYGVEPLARLVIWKGRTVKSAESLPYWFETFGAPAVAVILALIVLYLCGLAAHTRLRRSVDAVMLRVPVVSHVYDAVKSVIQVLEKSPEQRSAQRVVLVPFPHPGMRLPAIVTSSCRDIQTDRVLLCVYVPTTPVPTSGYFLMIPEDEVTELNWDVPQTLQAIISGGLAAPPLVSFFGTKKDGGEGPVVVAGPVSVPSAVLTGEKPFDEARRL
jgi:uncharacterized membrane protein